MSGKPLAIHNLLMMSDRLALCARALAGDPEQLDAEIRQVILEARLMVVNYDLTALHPSLCIAESLLLLKRPAEALAVIHSAARHSARGGN